MGFFFLSVSSYAPPAPERKPYKALLLAEKVHRASLVKREWVHKANLIDACFGVYKWSKVLEMQGHEELMIALFYVENRFTEEQSRSSRFFTQINKKYQWVFEREIWRKGLTLKTYDIGEQAALGVSAYRLKLIEAKGDPAEAVRIYNHGTHPFSYTHQKRVLSFYNLMERQ